MSTPQTREYLEAKVETANSAQLHLMLIDGALRFCREAEKGVLRGETSTPTSPRSCGRWTSSSELLAGVRHEARKTSTRSSPSCTRSSTRG